MSGSLASWFSRIWGLGRTGCAFRSPVECDFHSQHFRAALITIHIPAPCHWRLAAAAARSRSSFRFWPQLTRAGCWPAARVAVVILELPVAALYLFLCLPRL